ncbi:magnesium transporter MRS2-C-like isoform X1 [Lolium perenne]|nr:magnesium transporter MRS2-C-like isoform X1 [Lolium perenne]
MATGSPGHSADGIGGVAIDVEGDRKREVKRSWVRVTATTDAPAMLERTKLELIDLLDLSVRDLRLADPSFFHSGIITCGHAIVCGLEPLRCIITADEALFLQEISDEFMGCAAELHRRFVDRDDDLPFEFIALEVVLEASFTYFDMQIASQEMEAYPMLGILRTKTSTLALERVRRLKKMLLNLIERVQKVRDNIEHLMNDNDKLAKCYLTEKKRMEAQSLIKVEEQLLDEEGLQVPISTVSLPYASRSHGNSNSPESNHYNTARLELLLEDYFLKIDGTVSKLNLLKDYIDDTEYYVNFQLDVLRNKLLKFELVLGSAAFVVALFAVVPAVFGMNFEGVTIYKVPHAFEETLGITGICSLVMFVVFLWYLKRTISI